MRLGRWIVTASLAVAGCSGDDGERVTVDQLTDDLLGAAELPDDAAGVDLEELAPPDEVTFCDAAGSAPARWLTDAVVPIQFWVDTFSTVDEVPADAAGPVGELLEFGDRRLRWHFGRLDERPEWTAAHAASALDLFDEAIDECDELPLVVGLAGASARPSGWEGLNDAEVADLCAGFAADVADGIAWYTAERGEPPRHQQQIALLNDRVVLTAVEETGDWPDDVPLYVTSDWYGVGTDGAPAAVPGGACDRG